MTYKHKNESRQGKNVFDISNSFLEEELGFYEISPIIEKIKKEGAKEREMQGLKSAMYGIENKMSKVDDSFDKEFGAAIIATIATEIAGMAGLLDIGYMILSGAAALIAGSFGYKMGKIRAYKESIEEIKEQINSIEELLV